MSSGDRPVAAAAVLGLAVGIGLAVAGFLVGQAALTIRAADRYVSVKGLAEREVRADLVVWPISFSTTGNDLLEVQAKLDGQRGVVRAFLVGAGFGEGDLSELPPRITDFQADRYLQAGARRETRYLAQATLTLRTGKVDAAQEAMSRSGELVSSGIVLAGQDYGTMTQYLFTSLNDIKPDMIAEATRNARLAAEQFARDSGSGVGAIRKATQGLFSIEDRDSGSPDYKKVRVVTSVEYFLED